MNAPADHTKVIRQHLIDPELCIRCNTCEETCPANAITHDARNYVVRFDVCEGCMACISPCPSGAIDSWRNVESAIPYSLEEQFGWDALPTTRALDALEAGIGGAAAETPAEAQAPSEA
ncbi:MAG: 4Fe-4S binding protein, partial [Thauera sp.]